MLIALLILFYIQMNLLEAVIKEMMICEPNWISFSNYCQFLNVDGKSINNAIELVVANDAVGEVKKLLYVDFGFMLCTYPLLYLLLMQLRTLYDEKTNKRLIHSITILGYLQFLSLGADIVENYILLDNLDKYEFTVSDITIHFIESIKWGFASLGAMVFLIATLIWAVGFVRETEKASADLNY